MVDTLPPARFCAICLLTVVHELMRGTPVGQYYYFSLRKHVRGCWRTSQTPHRDLNPDCQHKTCALLTVVSWELIFMFHSILLFFCPCLSALMGHCWLWVTGHLCWRLSVTQLRDSALSPPSPEQMSPWRGNALVLLSVIFHTHHHRTNVPVSLRGENSLAWSCFFFFSLKFYKMLIGT